MASVTISLIILMTCATGANAQNMTLNVTQQNNQTQQNQTRGFGSLLGNIIGSAIVHGLGLQNGTSLNGTEGPCLRHGTLLYGLTEKFMLQDEKIELLEHNVSQAQAQHQLTKKENAAFCK